MSTGQKKRSIKMLESSRKTDSTINDGRWNERSIDNWWNQ